MINKCDIFKVNCFTLMNLMIDFKIIPNLIICDPPYDIKINSCEKVQKNVKYYQNEYLNCYKELKQNNLNMSYDIQKFAELVDKLQKGNINIYFFCNKKQIPLYLKTYIEMYKCNFDILFWNKPNALPTYFNKYLNDCEYLLYFHKGKRGVKPANYEDAKTIYINNINIKDKKKYKHPTIKPLPLIEKIIRNSTNEGDLVLDTFLGSGTSAVASILNNRNFIGCEILEKWYKVSLERIDDMENQNCNWNKKELSDSDIIFIKKILSVIEKLKNKVIAYSYLDGNEDMTNTWWIVSISDFDLYMNDKNFKKMSKRWFEIAQIKNIKLIFICEFLPNEKKLLSLAEENNLIINV